MYPDKLKQYVYETGIWARLLEYFRQENIFFKTRLADFVSASTGHEIVVAAEKFQEEFLAQDRIISFLEIELTKQKILLESDVAHSEMLKDEVVQNQDRLRNDIKKAELNFSNIKKEFLNFLIGQLCY